MKIQRRIGVDSVLSELLLNEGYTKAELARYLETTHETINAVLMNIAGRCLVRAIKKKLACRCYV